MKEEEEEEEEEEEGAEKKESREKKKKKPKKYSGWIKLLAEMAETDQNRPKFWPRWNMGVPRTGLHAGTRFSIRSEIGRASCRERV